jgi:hypothetical protein
VVRDGGWLEIGGQYMPTGTDLSGQPPGEGAATGPDLQTSLATQVDQGEGTLGAERIE